jgi:hypothetical protein
MMRSTLAIVVMIFAFSGLGNVRAATDESMISKRDAVRLIMASLPPKARKLPQLGLDVRLDEQNRRYYTVDVTWAGLPDGSAVYGSYYVDRETGDVWNAVVECTQIDTAALRKLQAAIRTRIGLSESDYQKQKQKGPLCP